MEIKYLEVLVMPNKELLNGGNSLGFLGTGEKSIDPKYLKIADQLIEKGRLSVLKEFDDVCQSDAFVGLTNDEWNAVKKFFSLNKAISGWDKQN